MAKGKYPNGVAAAMERAGIGQSELARLIGENRQQVSRWVHGERKLTPAYASKIGAALNASPSELFMPADAVDPLPVRERPNGGLGPTLRQARQQRSRTIREVADAADVGVDELDEWEAGETQPNKKQLAKIAAFLAVEVASLSIGRVIATDDEPLADAVFVSGSMPAYSGPRDVEKLGVVAAGNDGDFEFNGEIAEYVARPKGLTDRPGVFSLEIISDSMYPAYRKGDPIFCDRTEPEVGDDVVIETFPEEGSKAGKSFVKRLKRRSKSTLVVEQFNPPMDLTFDPYAIKHLWRVVPPRELHGYR